MTNEKRGSEHESSLKFCQRVKLQKPAVADGFRKKGCVIASVTNATCSKKKKWSHLPFVAWATAHRQSELAAAAAVVDAAVDEGGDVAAALAADDGDCDDVRATAGSNNRPEASPGDDASYLSRDKKESPVGSQHGHLASSQTTLVVADMTRMIINPE